ncbi:uncharacterized protein LOC143461594 [Clavelina lepadiformis]|uniref:uncharacterized protein LOC143461594 n=1 Tax=Clavelina lepadiformis TaxID=159417 RepID=UPI004041FDB3
MKMLLILVIACLFQAILSQNDYDGNVCQCTAQNPSCNYFCPCKDTPNWYCDTQEQLCNNTKTTFDFDKTCSIGNNVSAIQGRFSYQIVDGHIEWSLQNGVTLGENLLSSYRLHFYEYTDEDGFDKARYHPIVECMNKPLVMSRGTRSNFVGNCPLGKCRDRTAVFTSHESYPTHFWQLHFNRHDCTNQIFKCSNELSLENYLKAILEKNEESCYFNFTQDEIRTYDGTQNNTGSLQGFFKRNVYRLSSVTTLDWSTNKSEVVIDGAACDPIPCIPVKEVIGNGTVEDFYSHTFPGDNPVCMPWTDLVNPNDTGIICIEPKVNDSFVPDNNRSGNLSSDVKFAVILGSAIAGVLALALVILLLCFGIKRLETTSKKHGPKLDIFDQGRQTMQFASDKEAHPDIFEDQIAAICDPAPRRPTSANSNDKMEFSANNKENDFFILNDLSKAGSHSDVTLSSISFVVEDRNASANTDQTCDDISALHPEDHYAEKWENKSDQGEEAPSIAPAYLEKGSLSSDEEEIPDRYMDKGCVSSEDDDLSVNCYWERNEKDSENESTTDLDTPLKDSEVIDDDTCFVRKHLTDDFHLKQTSRVIVEEHPPHQKFSRIDHPWSIRTNNNYEVTFAE